jgi:hypothetical protein
VSRRSEEENLVVEVAIVQCAVGIRLLSEFKCLAPIRQGSTTGS